MLGMLGSLIPGVISLLTKAIPDADLRNRILQEAQSQQFQLDLQNLVNEAANATAQINVNQAEAATGSLYLAGWRALFGWTSALGFALNVLVFPLTSYFFALFGKVFLSPSLDMTAIMVIGSALLGIGAGALRTYEKVKGVATQQIVKNKDVVLQKPFT